MFHIYRLYLCWRRIVKIRVSECAEFSSLWRERSILSKKDVGVSTQARRLEIESLQLSRNKRDVGRFFFLPYFWQERYNPVALPSVERLLVVGEAVPRHDEGQDCGHHQRQNAAHPHPPQKTHAGALDKSPPQGSPPLSGVGSAVAAATSSQVWKIKSIWHDWALFWTEALSTDDVFVFSFIVYFFATQLME